jgi:hypothetical protein
VNPTVHPAKIPSPRTGLFAVLWSAFGGRGSGAPELRQGACAPHRFGARRRAVTAVITLILTLTVGLAAADAAVTHEFLKNISEVPVTGPHGEAVPLAGDLTAPEAMTVDSGHLWVAEHVGGTTRHRVDVFDSASGAFLSQFAHNEQGLAFSSVAVGHTPGESQPTVYLAESPGGVGVYTESGTKLARWTGAAVTAEPFGALSGVAVDNSETIGAGEVYVADAQHGAVDVFRPEAGGSEHFVAQLTGTCASTKGCTGEAAFAEPRAVAVDRANGDLLVLDRGTVDVFESKGLGAYSFLRALAAPASLAFTARGVEANDAAGSVYVDGEVSENGESRGEQVLEFAAAGAYLGRLTATPEGPFASTQSVAVDPGSGDVYVGEYRGGENIGVIQIFGPDLLVPEVTTAPASEVTATSATLNGTIDPEGHGEASCRFAWGVGRSLGEVASCPPVLQGSGAVPRSAMLTKLSPDTEYCFRMQAANASGLSAGESAQDQCFSTPGPGIPHESASDVFSTSATLEATIDPHGEAVSYYFQYSNESTEACGGGAVCAAAPTPPGAPVGAEETVVEQRLQGLAANTVYHYRVVALTPLGAFFGPDRTFNTQSRATGAALPDGRRWELVSPADKHGAVIAPTGYSTADQSSPQGGAIVYSTNGPTEAGVKGFSETAQLLSTRGDAGWSTTDVALPHGKPAGFHNSYPEFPFFSADLSSAIVEPLPPWESLGAEASPSDTEDTPYLWHGTAACEATPRACFTPIATRAPAGGDVPAGAAFGGHVKFQSGTPDLAHVIVQSRVPLTNAPIQTTQGESPSSEPPALYEWSRDATPAAQLQPVSVLPPNGAVVSGTLGERAFFAPETNQRPTISADGSRVFWTHNEEALYMRDQSRAETVRLDAVAPGASGAGQPAPSLQSISEDGSVAFFTDEQRLTADSGATLGKPDLYVCAIVLTSGRDACELHDLTPRTAAGRAAGVLGLTLGASDNGDYVYFVAARSLTTRPNAQGALPLPEGENLYIDRRGGSGAWEAPGFIAGLTAEDEADWGHTVERELAEQTARVAPDGRYLAFMSSSPLTGYDNRDVHSGHRDEEVYLYDAATGKLSCASCDPTGARPVGIEYKQLESNSLVEPLYNVVPGADWVAATLPGWARTEGSALARILQQRV